jgi:hypothetical protein
MKQLVSTVLFSLIFVSLANGTEQFANSVVTTLNGGINNSVNSVVVTSATGMPGSGTFRLLVDNEIMLVRAISGTALTVTRGAESTTAASHNNGATVTALLTAGALAQLKTDLSPSGTANTPLFNNGSNGYTNGTRSGNTTSVATTSGILTNNHCAKFDASGNIVDQGAVCAAPPAGTANTPLFNNGSGGYTNGTRSGNTTSVATTSGTLTNNDCAKFDASGNIVDNGSACGGGGGGPTNPLTSSVSFTPDATGTNTHFTNANTAGWLDPASFGASYSTNSYSGTATSGNTTITMPSNDFIVPNGVFIPHGGTACSINSTVCTSITMTAPTVEPGTCVANVQASSPYSAANWQDDIGMFYSRNMEPVENNGSGGPNQYSVSSGSYSYYSDFVPQTVCWGLTVGAKPAGSHSMAVKVAALDANGGMTAASPATTISSVAMAFPTGSAPWLIYEGTPVTNAAGYAFWESIDGGSYFLARVVWTNEPWVDEGASQTHGGAGYVEWGSIAVTSEDIPSTPPASALNDDLLADKIVSKSGNNLVLTTAPSVTGAVTVAHDDASAWHDMLIYCGTKTNKSCKVQVRSGTTRLSSLVSVQSSVTKLAIEGQNEYSSVLQFFGNGGAKVCPVRGTNPSVLQGGQFQDSSILTLRYLRITSTNGAADCLVDVDSTFEAYVDMSQLIFGSTGEIHRALVVGDTGGKIGGIVFGTGFLQDIDLGTASNGMFIGGEGTSGLQDWPGNYLYPQIGYLGGSTQVTINTWIFENGWNAIRPDGNAQGVSGGYINGLDILNPYISDMGDCSAADFCATPLANYISGSSVTASGTAVTLNATNAHFHDTTIFGLPGLGCVWAQNYTGSANALIKNVGCNYGKFGIISDSQLDAESNRFANLATNGIGIAVSYAGSTVFDNSVGGATGATGTIGYYLGYLHNVSGQGCSGPDSIHYRASLGSNWTSGGAAVATVLNACPTAPIDIGGVYMPTTLSSLPFCSAAYEGREGRATNCSSVTAGTPCSGSGTTHAQIICNGNKWVQMGF